MEKITIGNTGETAAEIYLRACGDMLQSGMYGSSIDAAEILSELEAIFPDFHREDIPWGPVWNDMVDSYLATLRPVLNQN